MGPRYRRRNVMPAALRRRWMVEVDTVIWYVCYILQKVDASGRNHHERDVLILTWICNRRTSRSGLILASCTSWYFDIGRPICQLWSGVS